MALQENTEGTRPVLRDRYEVGEVVGQGAFGTTYAATDRQTGKAVVIKHLSLRGLPDWKPVEHFEREARVLRSLDHPGIPEFVDAFEGDAAGGHDFYIVSRRVQGQTLAAKIEAGARWTPEQAAKLFERLLETLDYLHNLSPRVIHRDIKPGNIVVRPDGSPVLVDFGAVRDVAGQHAMTVVGTAGYMPPEQAMGRAEPRSDLYALAATIVHALTHRHPSDLPREGLQLRFRDLLGVRDHFAEILVRLLDPDPDERFPSASAVLQALRSQTLQRRPEPEPSDRALARTDGTAGTTALALPDAPREITPAIAPLFSYTRALQTMGPKAPIAAGMMAAMLIGLAAAFKSAVFMPFFMLVLPAIMLGFPAKKNLDAKRLFRTGAMTRGHVLSARHRHGGQGLLQVEFEFEIGGQRYTGRLATDDAMVVRHIEPRAPIVLVFYDPEDPKRHTGVLEPELEHAMR